MKITQLFKANFEQSLHLLSESKVADVELELRTRKLQYKKGIKRVLFWVTFFFLLTLIQVLPSMRERTSGVVTLENGMVDYSARLLPFELIPQWILQGLMVLLLIRVLMVWVKTRNQTPWQRPYHSFVTAMSIFVIGGIGVFINIMLSFMVMELGIWYLLVLVGVGFAMSWTYYVHKRERILDILYKGETDTPPNTPQPLGDWVQGSLEYEKSKYKLVSEFTTNIEVESKLHAWLDVMKMTDKWSKIQEDWYKRYKETRKNRFNTKEKLQGNGKKAYQLTLRISKNSVWVILLCLLIKLIPVWFGQTPLRWDGTYDNSVVFYRMIWVSPVIPYLIWFWTYGVFSYFEWFLYHYYVNKYEKQYQSVDLEQKLIETKVKMQMIRKISRASIVQGLRNYIQDNTRTRIWVEKLEKKQAQRLERKTQRNRKEGREV